MKFKLSNFKRHYQLQFTVGKELGYIFFTDWEWNEQLKLIVLTGKDIESSAYLPIKKKIFEEKIKIIDGKYSPHVLAGVGRRSGNSNSISGTKVCYVEKIENGDNFSKSLCGRTPSRRSMGWYEALSEVNCEKCLKKMRGGVHNG